MRAFNVQTKRKPFKGFTIVELLVSMAVLTTLLTITLIAIRPQDNFSKSRNTKRRADVEALASAIQQYSTSNRGVLPAGITATLTPISSGGVNVCSILIPNFIAALPQDPSSNNGQRITASECSNYNTGYSIVSTTGGHFSVQAPSAELGQTITELR